MGKKLKIFNGKIITPSCIIESGTVVVNEAGIIETVTIGDVTVNDAIEIDAAQQYISPGFIDIHVHGGGGHDFMDGTELAFLKIAEMHLQYGTTAMVPTTLTSDTESLWNTLLQYEIANAKNTKGATFLGMHIEGPYFAMSQRGAQMPEYIRDPNPDEYKTYINRFKSVIKRWSAAPELKGAINFGRYLQEAGIIASVAHTDAIYEDVVLASKNGYSLFTHLYSAMSGVTRRNGYRYAGVIESAFLIDEMDVEIIADGIHLPAPLLQLIYKIKGPDRIALITDSMRGSGMPEGESVLGNKDNGLKVLIEDGVAKLLDRTAFAGSVATTNRLVRTMIQMADIPLIDAIKMMSTTPARIMGVHATKGSLEVGKHADIVLFNEQIEIDKTIIKGEVLYSKN
ncbi:MAG: N-acetylglucosamine-6-phosphate deacetylase [Bacteroidetes bacterium]|nr:N-acetylglucosamine-6-phosphate deacetylase [Bacteroidota bacterium]